MQQTELYSTNCGSVGDRRTARLAKTTGSIALEMTIRLLASYEFIDKEGRAGGIVRLPVDAP
jgi:hypothetical protein